MLRPRLLVVSSALACGSAPDGSTGDSVAPTAADVPTTSADAPTTTTADPSAGSGSGGPTTTTTPATSATTADTTADTTGATACDKHVVLMGYWPPTNEMLRPWSRDPAQNPGGWIGEDWHGHGYDVVAFFPEFPPDGDPSNDAIGQDGAVGSPDFDLRVDYQATSADFWRIVDALDPLILVTTSRGGAIGWEIEAVEGGHGVGNAGDPALDWASDAHGRDTHPTQATIDARSWAAITGFRQGTTLPTQLPVRAIVDATSALGLTRVVVDQTGTSGNFLSGFLGLHGLYYQSIAPHAVAAGHIHVGAALPVADAGALIEATLEAVLAAHPAAGVACP